MTTPAGPPGAPPLPYDDDLRLALRIADAADAESMARFDAADLEVETKADSSPVSEADLAAERAIRRMLEAERPADGIVGEEFGRTGDASRQWIVDPIDGTANYVRGIPMWGTLISLVEHGHPVVGVVSIPALGRRWWAAEGAGAWTNTSARPTRLRVSAIDAIEQASISFQSLAQWREAGHLNALLELAERVHRDRAYGDVWPYMMLAEGRLEFVAEFDMKEYDIAAFVPIITEAGGRVTSFDGDAAIDTGSAFATNGVLHEALLGHFHPPAP
ncbi:histidinol phosphatase [Microbacterium sp. LRZ72]|uniref:inositol monophosphatase family protein n=1 Tax=Microbacterium sp. LRZ72 TaxID=2942481 RepID=UPI0029A1674A|nr:inositol monophosphatase family protein [Microbacterium sp. LRZ72]MDX2377888.1 histidinol phosphatase [Microbacterium sp. LRZ72]